MEAIYEEERAARDTVSRARNKQRQTCNCFGLVDLDYR